MNEPIAEPTETATTAPAEQQNTALYFDARHLPAARNEYVAWIDVMGTKSSMSRSVHTTANFIFKMHAAAIQAKRPGMSLYPVMDGVYATCASQPPMRRFIRDMFRLLADTFIGEHHEPHRFVIRGGLALGPTMHGRDLGHGASPVLSANGVYRDAILLGMPMVQAHLIEQTAPPFGIAVHESARVFTVGTAKPFTAAWYRWVSGTLATSLERELNNYFTWRADRSMPLLYEADRIAQHREMVRQYFAP